MHAQLVPAVRVHARACRKTTVPWGAPSTTPTLATTAMHTPLLTLRRLYTPECILQPPCAHNA